MSLCWVSSRVYSCSAARENVFDDRNTVSLAFWSALSSSAHSVGKHSQPLQVLRAVYRNCTSASTWWVSFAPDPPLELSMPHLWLSYFRSWLHPLAPLLLGPFILLHKLLFFLGSHSLFLIPSCLLCLEADAQQKTPLPTHVLYIQAAHLDITQPPISPRRAGSDKWAPALCSMNRASFR